MNTILITPNSEESIPFLKELLSKLSDVKKVEILSDKPAQKSRLYKDIDAGFKEVKKVIEGKKEAKTFNQFLNEI